MTGGTVAWKFVLLLLQSPARDVSQAGTKTPDPAITQQTPLTHSRGPNTSIRQGRGQGWRDKQVAFTQQRLQPQSVSSASVPACLSFPPPLSTPLSLFIYVPPSIALLRTFIQRPVCTICLSILPHTHQ